MRNSSKVFLVLMFATLLLSACATKEASPVPQTQDLKTETDAQAVLPTEQASPATDGQLSEEGQGVGEEDVIEPEPQTGDGTVPDEGEPNKDELAEVFQAGDSNKCYELASSGLQRDCLLHFGVEIKYGEGDESTQAPVLPAAERVTQ